MKQSRLIAAAVTALFISPFAHAQQHGATYGTVKAVFDYCAQVDARHRTEYQVIAARVLTSVAASKDAGNEQAAYATTSDAIAKLSPDESRATCTAGGGVAVSGGDPDGRDDHDRDHDHDHDHDDSHHRDR